MGRRTNPVRHERLRLQLAHEAARILAEEGETDFHRAKKKAAARLNVGNKTVLPTNREIESALAEHQRLFRGETQTGYILALRKAAIELMRELHCFQPRLVGAVLRGTADSWSAIELHLFADTPEEIAIFLLDRGIPFQVKEHLWRRKEGTGTTFTPVYITEFSGYEVKLYVFPAIGLRNAPLCPIEKRPMRRMDLTQVTRLIESQ
ncbi:MAG: hypothetical protein Kow006_07590 [Gammaproteobacteria bacterium]